MGRKKSVPVVSGESSEVTESDKTVYSVDMKKALISNYKTAEEQIQLLEAQLEEARRCKSDVAFEMQKAFGNNKFTIDGVICQVVGHKYEGREETTYYLKKFTMEVTEHF
jgi:hypothetical protein